MPVKEISDASIGLRCLTVRVSDSDVRRLISTGYLSLERSEVTAAVAIALEVGLRTISHEPGSDGEALGNCKNQ